MATQTAASPCWHCYAGIATLATTTAGTYILAPASSSIILLKDSPIGILIPTRICLYIELKVLNRLISFQSRNQVLSKAPNMAPRPHHPTTVQAQALALLTAGISEEHVSQITHIPPRTLRYIKKKARDRGYNPEIDGRILEDYVKDGAHTGRPKEISEETELALIQSASKDRAGREKSAEVLAYEAGISHRSAVKILHKYGFTNAKPTTKPGLSEEAKAERLAFAERHKDWTLEDWKNVIWSDETSVVLGHRRGGIRIWRRPSDRFEPSCVRR